MFVSTKGLSMKYPQSSVVSAQAPNQNCLEKYTTQNFKLNALLFNLPQRNLLMKNQQRRRADTQMVRDTRDSRQKKRKHKVVSSDVSQSRSSTSLSGEYGKK